MNIKLAYYTKTGHSRKIAEAIGIAFSIEPMNIEDNSTIYGADILIIVGGIYNGVSSDELIQFAKRLKPSMAQRVAIITSSAFRKDNQEKLALILKSNYIEVLGECEVRGAFTVISMGHPNRMDFNTAIEFIGRFVDELEGESDARSSGDNEE